MSQFAQAILITHRPEHRMRRHSLGKDSASSEFCFLLDSPRVSSVFLVIGSSGHLFTKLD